MIRRATAGPASTVIGGCSVYLAEDSEAVGHGSGNMRPYASSLLRDRNGCISLWRQSVDRVCGLLSLSFAAVRAIEIYISRETELTAHVDDAARTLCPTFYQPPPAATVYRDCATTFCTQHHCCAVLSAVLLNTSWSYLSACLLPCLFARCVYLIKFWEILRVRN